MKTWYKAVCDEHKSMIDCFCNNPLTTAHYLGKHNEDIHQWFSLHYGCKLRLIHFDEDSEECWNKGYEDVFMDDLLRTVKKKN